MCLILIKCLTIYSIYFEIFVICFWNQLNTLFKKPFDKQLTEILIESKLILIKINKSYE